MQERLNFTVHQKYTNKVFLEEASLDLINYPTSKIPEYVDYYLQLLVNKIPPYVKDTNDFLNKMKDINKDPEETYLATMDVKSLYISVPNL